ncbi:RcnB family protein [Paenirhodobacter enshiensis]|uniref:Excinuclease ABC subunit A n=1 Tax=Paenirhodobacter enshiensis TaxID=1105367 RepID=A0A086XWY4_9RHOB|nr:RcnB family protein [Paenirhodobacter enshiensis]KFI26534.1 hypothetical protein CG50_02055 [Paenirhodobacter enshiensis]
MRKMANGAMIAALATGLALGLGSTASAETPATACPGGQPCAAQPSPTHRNAQNAAPQQKLRKPQNHAPHVGESARRAPMLQQARDSRLPPPPKGQHYRIMDDRVVRVDDQTARIVAIIGLTRDLLGAR